MEYSVRLISINKTPLTISGVIKPLCNDCMSVDCTNPIAKTSISLFGKEEKYRLYKSGDSYRAVVDCDGYMQIPDRLSGSDIEDIEDIEDTEDME